MSSNVDVCFEQGKTIVVCVVTEKTNSLNIFKPSNESKVYHVVSGQNNQNHDFVLSKVELLASSVSSFHTVPFKTP